jgi:hypothetical protein
MLSASAMNVSAANFVKARHSSASTTSIAPKGLQKLNMSNGIAAFYDAGTTANNYYIILSNSEDTSYSSSDGSISAKDAYVLALDLYAANGSSDALVEGTYKGSSSNGDMTYDTKYSEVKYYDGNGNCSDATTYALNDDITVVKNDNGSYTITTTFALKGIETDLTFTGKVPLGASSSSSV